LQLSNLASKETIKAPRRKKYIDFYIGKKALHDHHLSFGSYRSSSEENQQFIKDYE
jgi:hypothetical protein